MFRSKPQHSYVDIFEGILIGGSLVAMTTFLFGTKKGKKLQKDLVHQYRKMRHKASDLREKIEKTVKSATPSKLKRAAKIIRAEARRGVKRTARKVKDEARRSAKRTATIVRAEARLSARRIKSRTTKTRHVKSARRNKSRAAKRRR